MVLGILVALPPFFFVGTRLFKQKSVIASSPDLYALNHTRHACPFLVCVSKSFVRLRILKEKEKQKFDLLLGKPFLLGGFLAYIVIAHSSLSVN